FIRGLYVSAASAIDNLARLTRDADFRPIFLNLESDAGRLAADGERDVGNMDRRFARNDAALLRLRLALMLFDDVDAAHEHALFLRHHLQDFSLNAAILAREHDNLVALLDLGGHYSTSGASETIFMWFAARSS